MKKHLGIALLALAVVGCTASDRTVKTLKDAGYTEVQTTGYKAFACGEDDTFSTGFRAKNPHGMIVRGTVCCGLTKGCTIRH